MENNTIFADGLIVKESNVDFITNKLSVKVDEFKKFLDTHNSNGWVNLDIKVSKSGKPYASLNTWKPDTQQQPQQQNRPEKFDASGTLEPDSLPF